MTPSMEADLRRQSLAFFRAPHEDHNRRSVRTTMRDLRTRASRRRWNFFMRYYRGRDW